VWAASRRETRLSRTVVLKLKTADFKILTRSLTQLKPPSSSEELTQIALSLRDRVQLGRDQRYRLIGVGLHNFRDPAEEPAQPELFSEADALSDER
jgi:DNA polymerase IV